MIDPVFSYCFKCGRAYASESEDIRLRLKELTCPYCGELTHEHSASWKGLRCYKEGRHLPKNPEEGKKYDLQYK